MEKLKILFIVVLIFSLTGAFSVNMLGDNQAVENTETRDTADGIAAPGFYAGCILWCTIDTSFYVPKTHPGYDAIVDTCVRDNCD